MLDAVHFEQASVPAAAVLTEPFATTGTAIAELQGFDDYPFATVPHPIGSLTEAQADALADAVTATVLSLLTAPDARSTLGDESFDADAQLPHGDELTITDAAESPTAGSVPADVVEALAGVLRADRADLTASITGRHIALRLHIPDEACAECVLPASMLVPMFQHRFDTELGPGWTITLDDPRKPEHSGPVND